jgi:hypothetical protein
MINALRAIAQVTGMFDSGSSTTKLTFLDLYKASLNAKSR